MWSSTVSVPDWHVLVHKSKKQDNKYPNHLFICLGLGAGWGNSFSFSFSFFLSFLGLVPRLGVSLELLPLAYARVTAAPDPSCVWDLYHSLRQRWTRNPLSEARDPTRNLMVLSRIHFHCPTIGTPRQFIFDNQDIQIFRHTKKTFGRSRKQIRQFLSKWGIKRKGSELFWERVDSGLGETW